MQLLCRKIAKIEFIKMFIEDYFGPSETSMGLDKSFGRGSASLCLQLTGKVRNPTRKISGRVFNRTYKTIKYLENHIMLLKLNPSCIDCRASSQSRIIVAYLKQYL